MPNLENKIDQLLSRLDNIEKSLAGIKIIEQRLDKIDSVLTNITKVKKDVNVLTKNLNVVIDKQQLFENQMQHHAELMEGYMHVSDNVIKKNTEIEGVINSLKQENRNKTNSINALQREINNLEQYGRRIMLVVKGVPKCDGEYTGNIVKQIAKLMDFDLSPTDV